jgi:hypothetical protein
MNLLFRYLLALLLVVLWAGPAVARYATGYDSAPQSTYSPTMMPQLVQGRIMTVDPAERKLTLDDGTQFLIPAWVETDWQALTQGNTVKVRYEDQEGQKVAIHIELKW